VASVMTYDLVSRMTSEVSQTGEPPLLTLTPYVWKGYVHAVLTAQEPGMSAPGKILETSVPVVEGMSGAPLIDERTLRVVGVLFGNRARSLVPAPHATTDSQSWYLPIGQALHWSHARDFLNSIGENAPNAD
jgi:hypothetical protein